MVTTSILCSLLLLLLAAAAVTGSGLIGVNWGELGNDLPAPAQVVQLLKTQGIQHVKLFDATPAILQALAGSGITVVVGVANDLVLGIGANLNSAEQWVQQNVVPYPDTNISYIAVGNEVLTAKKSLRRSLMPAILNLHTALVNLKLDSQVKVSTPMALNILTVSYPPSAGAFTPFYLDYIFKPLMAHLSATNACFMANAYPYFAYVSDTAEISLAYSIFEPNPGVTDAATGLKYTNLLSAQLDATFSAMAVLGYPDVCIIVGETGWPSKGDPTEVGVSLQNAETYNRNLVAFIQSGAGTPLRPNATLGAYIFALFNENLKMGKTSERNYGLFYPDTTPVYAVDFFPPAPPPTIPPALPNSPPPPTFPPALPNSPPAPTMPSPAISPPGDDGHHPPGEGHHFTDSWCIATPVAAAEALQQALDWACGAGGANCAPLQVGQPCYDPNTLLAHASYAFNSYYQTQQRAGGSCYFGGTAYVTSQDPSYNGCQYPAS